MSETEFKRSGHSAVHLDNYLIIIGGWWDGEELSTRIIWMYNLYTEVWSKHVIPKHVMEESRPVARLFCGGGQIGQILGPFMITRGLNCDCVGFGHFGGGSSDPPPGYGPGK